MDMYFLLSLQLTEDFLDIVDNILDVDQDILQESQETANTSAMWESICYTRNQCLIYFYHNLSNLTVLDNQ